MSKRARGVKKCVHYIAFWVRYAFGKTLHLEASRFVVSPAVVCSPAQWICSQLLFGWRLFPSVRSSPASLMVFMLMGILFTDAESHFVNHWPLFWGLFWCPEAVCWAEVLSYHFQVLCESERPPLLLMLNAFPSLHIPKFGMRS